MSSTDASPTKTHPWQCRRALRLGEYRARRFLHARRRARGFAWHLEGYKAATLDLSIPDYAHSAQLRARDPLPPGEKEAYGVLPNSALRTEGLSGGASYIWDRGYFGAAYSGFHTNYGTVAEPNVTIDMEQRRFDARGAFFDPFPLVKAINYRFGAADYTHTEFEGAETGTVFKKRRLRRAH